MMHSAQNVSKVAATALYLSMLAASPAEAYTPQQSVSTIIGPQRANSAPQIVRDAHQMRSRSPLAPFRNNILLADATRAKANHSKGFFAGFRAKLNKRYGNRVTNMGRMVRRYTHTPEKITPQQAAAELKAGDHVFMPIGHGAPHEIIDAVIKEVEKPNSRFTEKNPMIFKNLSNTASRKLFSLGKRARGKVKPVALFIGGNNSAAVAANVGDAIPIHLGEIPRAFREKRIRIDKALVKVSPPDADGYVTLGASTATTPAAIEAADLAIAEVNPNVPKTNGAARIHISQFDKWVESNKPLKALPENKIGPKENAIAKNVLEKVIKKHLPKSGLLGTFQFGIGGIPDAIAGGLVKMGRKLRVRSEMIADGVRLLEQAGLVDGTVDYTFYMGTQKGLDWLDGNRKLRAYPTEKINDSAKLGRIDNFVAINGAVEVDLFGSVNAQMINNEWYSGVGGQRDFMLGAKLSKGGLAVHTLRATAEKRNGDVISTIVWPWALGKNNEGLRFKGPKGETLVLRGKQPATTTSMHDVMFVVTEHGAADLTRSEYLSFGERMEALISVADPRFRPKLRELVAQRNDEGFQREVAKHEAYETKRAAELKTAEHEAKHPVATMAKKLAQKAKSRFSR